MNFTDMTKFRILEEGTKDGLLPTYVNVHNLNVITRVLIRERQKVQSHKKSVL